MAKTFGYGCVMVVATSTSGELTLGQIRSISGPGVDFADVDTTCMDSSSNYRTFVPGLGDGGEVTVSLAYDSTSLSHSRLCYYMNQRLSKTYTIFHGTTGVDGDSFSGYVKGFAREIPEDQMLEALLQAHHVIREICGLQRELREKLGVEKPVWTAPANTGLFDRLKAGYYDQFRAAKQTPGKQTRAEAVAALKAKAVAQMVPDPAAADAIDPLVLDAAWHNLESRIVRDLILSGTRPDGALFRTAMN